MFIAKLGSFGFLVGFLVSVTHSKATIMSIRIQMLLLFSLIILVNADPIAHNCDEPIEYINFLKAKLK